MNGRTGFSAVLVTTSSLEEGQSIARAVLERKLAACANLVPSVQSLFWWDGKLEEAQETIMILKTREEVLPQLIEVIKSLHSYTVCEVISLPITQGNPAYLDWIQETVVP